MKELKFFDPQDVPTLLLSYTYFLNSRHNSYINIGFDANTFNAKIILFRNNQWFELTPADWHSLLKSRQNICEFFSNNVIQELASGGIQHITWKLTRRKEGRSLVAVHFSNKRILISQDEWTLLNGFLEFLNNVFCWATDYQQYLKQYYAAYLAKCLEFGTRQLPSDKFFMLSSFNLTCNYSRLFAELPNISRNKLIADIHLNENRDVVN